MNIAPLSAVGVGALSPEAAPSAPTPSASGPSFAEALGKMFSDGVATVEAGEAAAIQGMTGAQPPIKVVEAVMAAQRTLQEGLSIRDKVVSAYQEISRMTI